MSAWDPPRSDALEYRYHVPPLADLEAWLARGPTLVNVSPATICPGCVVAGQHELWLLMNVTDLGSDVDLHWVQYKRATGDVFHQQQVFRKHKGAMWATMIYVLDSKPMGDYCPHCGTKLEWAVMAERCPSCWWVK